MEMFSIIFCGNPKYENIDGGNENEYLATGGHAKGFLKSFKNNLPMRLLRSSSLPDTNIYRPVVGFRYDGLYDVTGHYEMVVIVHLLLISHEGSLTTS